MQDKPGLIGIFGTGRNGSTLLLRLLDGIPKTYVHPLEIRLLCDLNDLAKYGKVKRITSSNVSTKSLHYLDRKIKTNILINYYFPYQVKDMEETFLRQVKDKNGFKKQALEEIRGKSEYTAQEFAEVFMGKMAEWLDGEEDIKNIIFKTIETPYIADYEKLFPEMRFIHIIRNPLEMWSSTKRTLMSNKSLISCYFGRDNLKAVIEGRWIPHAKALLERGLYRNVSHNEKHFLMKYEELIRHPQETISEVCQWLEVSLPKDPIRQTFLGGRVFESSFDNPSQKGVKAPLEVVSNLHEKFHYEEVITSREKNLIILRLLGLAKKLGYLEELSRPKKIKVFCQWLLPDKWEFMHVDTIKKFIKTFIAFFCRRFYILKIIFIS